MKDLYLYIGIIGNIISVLMFLSPVSTFWRIVKRKSTEEFESLPYICTLLNSALWTYYGITRPGSYLVSTVNGFGSVVEVIYLCLFIIYASPKIRVGYGFSPFAFVCVHAQFGSATTEFGYNAETKLKTESSARTLTLAGILDVGCLAAAILLTHFLMRGEARIDAIGFMCSGLNIIMYGSPLAAMKTVVTSRSVEYMPFFLSFFLFLNGGIWAFYAVLVDDWFLLVPNGIGFLLGTTQLVLYGIYCNSKSSKQMIDLEEAPTTHEPLLSSSASGETS